MHVINDFDKLSKNFKHKLFLEIRSNKNGLGEAYKHGFKWALNKNYEYIFQRFSLVFCH